MTRTTSLAIVAAGLILAAPALAQTPGGTGSPGSQSPGSPTIPRPPAPGTTTPGAPSPNTPGAPGSITPGTPGTTTPGTPGVNDPSRNPTFPCPPGQSRRPGSTVCSPSSVPTR